MSTQYVTLDALKGRGFFHFSSSEYIVTFGEKLKKKRYPGTKTPAKVIDYIKREIYDIGIGDCQNDHYVENYSEKRKSKKELSYLLSDCWVKSFPIDDMALGGFYILCIKLKNTCDKKLCIDNAICFRRFSLDYDFCYTLPRFMPATKYCYDDLSCLPDEASNEIDMLIRDRYLPNQFSIIGKPMPANKYEFHENPKYSIAHNSGYRRVYWNMRIKVNDDDVIQDISYTTWWQTGMGRPEDCNDDKIEERDAYLYFCDQYSDEEWEQIIH